MCEVPNSATRAQALAQWQRPDEMWPPLWPHPGQPPATSRIWPAFLPSNPQFHTPPFPTTAYARPTPPTTRQGHTHRPARSRVDPDGRHTSTGHRRCCTRALRWEKKRVLPSTHPPSLTYGRVSAARHRRTTGLTSASRLRAATCSRQTHPGTRAARPNLPQTTVKLFSRY